MLMNVTYEQKIKELDFLGPIHAPHVAPHLHRELELICQTEGEVVAYADTVRVVMHPGDVFLSFPNQIHSYDAVPGEEHIGFTFSPDILPDLAETFTTGSPQSPLIERAALDSEISFLLNALYATRGAEPTPYLSERQRGYLLSLCALLLPRMHVAKPTAGDSEAMRAIVSFCSRNYADDLSLELLGEKLHLNKYYISHLFSGKLGIRFNDYVNSLRVSEACKFLLNSDLNVTEIGSRVGFNTLRTFNRAFTKQVGLTPTEYRKRNLKGSV